MRDDDMTAADMCRVYAAAGVSATWSPTLLRRYADLLDKHTAYCAKYRDEAQAERVRAERIYRMIRELTILNVAVAGAWAVLVALGWV